jgi:hypothetical protein
VLRQLLPITLPTLRENAPFALFEYVAIIFVFIEKMFVQKEIAVYTGMFNPCPNVAT